MSCSKALIGQSVDLEKIILKPNMVVTGYASHVRASIRRGGKDGRFDALNRMFRQAVPAIAFLSGGQKDEEALDNLGKNEPGLYYLGPYLSLLEELCKEGALHCWSEGRED